MARHRAQMEIFTGEFVDERATLLTGGAGDENRSLCHVPSCTTSPRSYLRYCGSTAKGNGDAVMQPIGRLATLPLWMNAWTMAARQPR